jgi:hypothetical protein
MAIAARGSLACAQDVSGRSLADVRSDIDAAGISRRLVAPLIGVDEVFHETVFVEDVVYKPGAVRLAADLEVPEPKAVGVIVGYGRSIIDLVDKVCGIGQHVVDKCRIPDGCVIMYEILV